MHDGEPDRRTVSHFRDVPNVAVIRLFTAAPLPWQVRTIDRYVDGRWAPEPGPVPLRTPVRSP